MSRHVSRRDRWQAEGPTQHRSVDGLVVRRIKGVWWAEIAYQVLAAEAPASPPASWQAHHERIGPFKRPRNAMVEAERYATLLRNRHGERIQFLEPDLSRSPRE
jgi:hypothetical protein